MDFISTQKFVLTSPRKLREVVYLLKKMTPAEAVEKLPYLAKRAATPLRKVVKTAIANAEQKEISADKLLFKEIQIGEGPRLKRFRAGARGRAKPYKKRMSHIRVVLTVKEEVKEAENKKKSKKIDSGDTVKKVNSKVNKVKSKKGDK